MFNFTIQENMTTNKKIHSSNLERLVFSAISYLLGIGLNALRIKLQNIWKFTNLNFIYLKGKQLANIQTEVFKIF